MDPSYILNSSSLSTGGIVYVSTGSNEAETHRGSKIRIEKKPGVSPKLYFSYIKKKYGLLEKIRIERRLKKVEAMVEEALNLGQEALGEELFKRVVKETRESEMYALGYKVFIEEEHLEKFRNKVKTVMITKLKNFTGCIPEKNKKLILKAQKDKLFDEIVIVHYDPENDHTERTEEEKRDPIAFGRIKESTRYYFITDWEDEYCDLTLDDIVDRLNLDDDEIKLTKNPDKLN